MQRVFKAASICLLLSISLASCVPVTRVPDATAAPTNTVIPTSTKSPVPSATATQEQVESLIPIPTRNYSWVDTPTPIATPVTQASPAKLKKFTEEVSFNFILEMNDYSYNNFPSHDDWWTESAFVNSQNPVALAIQEYLYYFPQSSKADSLRWQLAFINAISSGDLEGNQFGDSWMIEELQTTLNNGETTPDQLEKILGQYWFDVAYLEPIENLFGDAKTGWLYIIVPQVWEDGEITKNQDYLWHGGLIVVVREVKNNEFQLFLLNSAWSFSFSESSVFKVSDHNENGKPEIALYIGSHSGTMCSGNLLIYEWENDRFVELTQNEVSLKDCTENFTYSRLDGLPSIVYEGLFPQRREIYVWNGASYEFEKAIDIAPFDLWQTSVFKTDFSYAEETDLLKDVLNSGEANQYGPAFPDYIRYRLGIAYAYQSKHDEAMNIFQELVSSPFDQTRQLFPNMARKFMEIYTDNGSLYNACQQSYKLYEQELDPYRNANGEVLKEEVLQQILGFNTTWLHLYFLRFCDKEDAFTLLIESISSTGNLSVELKKNGVITDYLQKIDANQDGLAEEWLVVLDTESFFLVYPQNSYFSAKRLASPAFYNNSDFNVTVETWNTFKNPIFSIFSGDELSILEVSADDESNSLLYEFGVTDFRLYSVDPVPQFYIFFRKPDSEWAYPDIPWYGYRWDADQREFRADLIEYQLFILRDPERAAEIVDEILPFLEEWKDVDNAWRLPYMYYISALSFELSGNKEKAAKIYWQLWHDFPESHYAVMAKYKLEPSNQ